MIRFDPGSGGGVCVMYLIGDYWHQVGGIVRGVDVWEFRYISGLNPCLPSKELREIADYVDKLNVSREVACNDSC